MKEWNLWEDFGFGFTFFLRYIYIYPCFAKKLFWLPYENVSCHECVVAVKFNCFFLCNCDITFVRNLMMAIATLFAAMYRHALFECRSYLMQDYIGNDFSSKWSAFSCYLLVFRVLWSGRLWARWAFRWDSMSRKSVGYALKVSRRQVFCRDHRDPSSSATKRGTAWHVLRRVSWSITSC